MNIFRPFLLALALACGTAAAQEPSVREVAFKIDSQPVDSALKVFAGQSGLQVLFHVEGVAIPRGTNSPGVAGTFTPQAALEQLLANTGLRYEFINARTVTIRAAKSGEGKTAGDDTAALQSEAVSIKLAQADDPQSAGTATEGSADRRTETRPAIPEILVSGSRVLNMDIQRTKDDIQPYVVFDRETIARSGEPDVVSFLLTRLTSLGGSGPLAQTSGGANRSAFDLRGLGSGQTLVLIDGHRAASVNYSGEAQQSDINGVPLAAIERIEVLPATASGIYGGGATGGVINVVLRRDYSGVETKLSYDNSFDGGGSRRRVDFSGGTTLEDGKTSIMLTGSYTDSSPLLVGDRDYDRRARAGLMANNPGVILGNYAPPLGATTNICSAIVYSSQFGICDGNPLILKSGVSLGSSVTHVPYGYDGPASDAGAQLIANAGSYNLDLARTSERNGGDGEALLNDPTVTALRLTVRRDFTEKLQGFLEMAGARNKGSFVSAFTGPFTLAAGAPANPFQQDIQITTPGFGLKGANGETIETRRLLAGGILKLPQAWSAALDYTWDRSRFSNTSTGNPLPEAADAIAAGTLDVFRDTNLNPVDFSDFAGVPAIVSPAGSTMNDATLRLSGPLGWTLPGGVPTLNFAVEHRQEDLDAYTLHLWSAGAEYLFTNNERSQTVQSVYAESIVPFVSKTNARTGIQQLELQLSARHDRYRMIGANQSVSGPGLDPEPAVTATNKFSSTDPTVGLRYQPLADITFRASYGTGFLPPSLAQLVPSQPQISVPFGNTDPLRGDEALGSITLYQGGNPNLRPEQSISRSVGFILTPRIAPNLRLSIDWTQIRKRDNALGLVTYLDLQGLIDNEALFSGVIIRGPASGGYAVGPIVAIDTSVTNVSRQDVTAYDIALDYRWDTAAFGSFVFNGAATHNINNTTELLPVLPEIETAGTAIFRKWLANASVSWQRGGWNARWTSRYFDKYWLERSHAVNVNMGRAENPSQIFHDAAVGYAFDRAGPMGLSGVEAQLGVRNVFNKRPLLQYAFWSAPYYDTSADPRGATYFLSLKKSF